MDKFVTYDPETRALIMECSDIPGDDLAQIYLSDSNVNVPNFIKSGEKLC